MSERMVRVRSISDSHDILTTQQEHDDWMAREQDMLTKAWKNLAFDLCGTKQARCALELAILLNERGVDVADTLALEVLQSMGREIAHGG